MLTRVEAVMFEWIRRGTVVLKMRKGSRIITSRQAGYCLVY